MWLLLAAILAASASERTPTLSPDSDFDLSRADSSKQIGRISGSYLEVAGNGLVAVFIGENGAILTQADLDGQVLHTTRDLGTGLNHVHSALFAPDGNVWLASSRCALGSGGWSGGTDEVDLYDPSGRHLNSIRFGAGYFPLASEGSRVLFLATETGQAVHVADTRGGRFRDEGKITLTSPLRGAIGLTAANGAFVLIRRQTGVMTFVDLARKTSSHIPLDGPHVIHAATMDGHRIYLLSGDNLYETDLAGHMVASYRLLTGHRFEGRSIGVNREAIYLMDRAGRVERFPLNEPHSR